MKIICKRKDHRNDDDTMIQLLKTTLALVSDQITNIGLYKIYQRKLTQVLYSLNIQ